MLWEGLVSRVTVAVHTDCFQIFGQTFFSNPQLFHNWILPSRSLLFSDLNDTAPSVFWNWMRIYRLHRNCYSDALIPSPPRLWMFSHTIHTIFLISLFPRTVPIDKCSWPTIANPRHWTRPGRCVEELVEVVHIRGYISVHVRCYLLSVRSEAHFRTVEDRELLQSLLPAVTRGLQPIFSHDGDYSM